MSTATGTATSIPETYLFDPSLEPSHTQEFFQGFLAKDELAVWIGHEKDRKTTVVLNFGIAAAVGRNFLGFRFVAPQPLRVVIFDYESKDHSIHRRYRAMCDALKLSDEERGRLKENLTIVELRRWIHDGFVIPRIDAKDGEKFWKNIVDQYAADLYIVDPMRCFHGGDENNSTMEKVLAGIRRTFQRTVVLPHHMVKRSQNRKENVRLKDEMRLWSEGARGSGAIKAHADVIVCQERTVEDDGTELVHWGAFLKDAPDVDPIALEESAPESFLWLPSRTIPNELNNTLNTLRGGKEPWANRTEVAEFLMQGGMKRATAYRHIKNLFQRGRLAEIDGVGIYKADPELR